jgi:Protein of unknown function (DUF998)
LALTPFLLVIILVAFLATRVIVFGYLRPGYSHRRDTLSELGEVGAPRWKLVSYTVFLPVGLGLLLCAWMLRNGAPPAMALALCLAIGYVGAALFPCDPGSPMQGSARQTAHNLAGGVQYVGGAVALWQLSASGGVLYQGLAAVVGFGALVLSLPEFRPVRGAVQRVAELALFGGLALASWQA